MDYLLELLTILLEFHRQVVWPMMTGTPHAYILIAAGKVFDPLCLMRREVVSDDVNLLAAGGRISWLRLRARGMVRRRMARHPRDY